MGSNTAPLLLPHERTPEHAGLDAHNAAVRSYGSSAGGGGGGGVVPPFPPPPLAAAAAPELGGREQRVLTKQFHAPTSTGSLTGGGGARGGSGRSLLSGARTLFSLPHAHTPSSSDIALLRSQPRILYEQRKCRVCLAPLSIASLGAACIALGALMLIPAVPTHLSRLVDPHDTRIIAITLIALGTLLPPTFLVVAMMCAIPSRAKRQQRAFFSDSLLEARTEGGSITEHYDVYGRAHAANGTVILLAGASCPRVAMKAFARELGRHTQVLCVDLPGHGSLVSVTFSLARCERLLSRVMDRELAHSLTAFAGNASASASGSAALAAAGAVVSMNAPKTAMAAASSGAPLPPLHGGAARTPARSAPAPYTEHMLQSNTARAGMESLYLSRSSMHLTPAAPAGAAVPGAATSLRSSSNILRLALGYHAAAQAGALTASNPASSVVVASEVATDAHSARAAAQSPPGSRSPARPADRLAVTAAGTPAPSSVTRNLVHALNAVAEGDEAEPLGGARAAEQQSVAASAVHSASSLPPRAALARAGEPAHVLPTAPSLAQVVRAKAAVIVAYGAAAYVGAHLAAAHPERIAGLAIVGRLRTYASPSVFSRFARQVYRLRWAAALANISIKGRIATHRRLPEADKHDLLQYDWHCSVIPEFCAEIERQPLQQHLRGVRCAQLALCEESDVADMRRWMAVSSRASVVSVAGADDDTLPTFNPTKVAAQCAQLVPFVDAAYNAFSDAVAPAEQTQRAAAAAMAATAAQAIAVAGARTSQAVDTMSISTSFQDFGPESFSDMRTRSTRSSGGISGNWPRVLSPSRG